MFALAYFVAAIALNILSIEFNLITKSFTGALRPELSIIDGDCGFVFVSLVLWMEIRRFVWEIQ